MKAICPTHEGPVDVPVSEIETMSNVNSIIFRCPICDEEVMLSYDSFRNYEETIKELYNE